MSLSHRTRVHGRLLLLATLALSLSACGGSGAGSHANAVGTPGSTPSAPSGGQLQTSLLDHYLGVGRSTDAGDDDEAAARKVEEAIAQCMAKQGFEYVPDPHTFTVTGTTGGAQIISMDNPTFPNLPPDQFAARFGYGISTAPPTSSKPDPGDQNEKIVHGMSVAERVAYYHALYGKDIRLDSRGDLTSSITSDDNSCDGRGDATRPDAQAEQSREQKIERVQTSYQSLLDQVKDLQDQELADPRVTAATQKWSACMASAGFPGYRAVSGPADRIRKRALALMGPGFDPSGVDPTTLAALRREEVSLAVADEHCHQAWDETLQAVREDLEAQFVAQNVTELKSYRSAMAAATR
jgi:hypothetical protein